MVCETALKTYSTMNSSQNRSKIKLVGENAVIRVHESCSPWVMYNSYEEKKIKIKIKINKIIIIIIIIIIIFFFFYL